jgi:hypothetical protein
VTTRKGKITPQDVAAQLEWDISKVTLFCADALEDANDHNVSAALRVLDAGHYDLACEFLKLEMAHQDAGEMTDELRARHQELVRLAEGALK